jgi:hypothetical protein
MVDKLLLYFYAILFFQDEINQMTFEESREILLHVLERNPTVMIDIMRPAVRQPGGFHPDPDVQATDWCVCTKCREIPTEIEKSLL